MASRLHHESDVGKDSRMCGASFSQQSRVVVKNCAREQAGATLRTSAEEIKFYGGCF